MSGNSVASDSMSSAASSSRSGTTSPDADGHSFSNYSSSHGRWENRLGLSSPTSAVETIPETLNNDEIVQIESFYKGLFSQVYVCPAIASLYVCQPEAPSLSRSTKPNPSLPNGRPQLGWALHFSEGVPVVVQATRPDKKSVHIIFAERGTGFPLWRDSLSASSKYSTVDVDYHEWLASNLTTKIGLRIFSGAAAGKFLQQVVSIVSNPVNFADFKGKRNSTPKKTKKSAQPKKTSISPPCCFSHLVHVAKDDQLASLSQFVLQPQQLFRKPSTGAAIPTVQFVGTFAV